MTILPKPVSRRKKITRKKTYWKNCQISENSKNDKRTTPNKPYLLKENFPHRNQCQLQKEKEEEKNSSTKTTIKLQEVYLILLTSKLKLKMMISSLLTNENPIFETETYSNVIADYEI